MNAVQGGGIVATKPIGGASGGLRVWVDAPPGPLASATVHLRWAVGEGLVDQMYQHGAANPQLLVIVTHGIEVLHRCYFPLRDESGWLPFFRAGANTVRAIVVWPWSGTKVSRLSDRKRWGDSRFVELFRPNQEAARSRQGTLQSELAALEPVEGQEEVEGREERRVELRAEIAALEVECERLNSEEPQQVRLREIIEGVFRLKAETKFDVPVPADRFADPHKHTLWLARRYPWAPWLREALKDNGCHVRARASVNSIASIPFAPTLGTLSVIGAALWYVVASALTLLFLFFGVRGVSWVPSPWKAKWCWGEILNVVEDTEASVWWSKKTGIVEGKATYAPRHWVFRLLNPPVALLLAIICWVVWFFWNKWLLWGLIGLCALVVLVVIIALLGMWVHSLFENSADERKARKRAREAAQQKAKDRRRRAALVALTENRSPLGRRIVDWLLTYKYRVCKPMQR